MKIPRIPIRKNILRSLLVKEFRQIFRDKRMRAMLFVSPVIMLLLLGYAVNTDVNRIKLAVLDEDRTSESRRFIRKFTASGYFIYQADLRSAKEADALLDKGSIDLFMHMPAGFSKDVRAGKHSDVQIILDGTDSSRASVIMSYVTMITNDFSVEYLSNKIKMLVLARDASGMRMKESVGVRERVMFNPDLKSRNFFLPGVLALLISVITIMLTSMAVVKEKESGTIEQIIVSPLRPVEYIAGKTLPFAIIAFFDICLVTLIAIGWFGVPFNGNFIFLLFSGMIYVISALSVGLYISTVSQTQQAAMISTFLYFMPALMFCGFVFPIYAMPPVIQFLTYINPIRYFIEIIRGVFLKGVGFSVLWPQVTILAVMASCLLALSVRRFSRRMD